MRCILVYILFFYSANFYCQKLVWASGYGSTSGGGIMFTHMAVDKNNNIITGGAYSGTIDFDPDTSSLVLSGYHSVFLAKHSPENKLIWVKKILASGTQPQLNSLSTFSNGDILIGGNAFAGSVYFTTVDSVSFTNNYSFFLARISANGNFIWAKNFGPNINASFCINSIDEIILAGSVTDTIDLSFGGGTAITTAIGKNDFILAKYNSNCNYVWSQNHGSFLKSNSASSVVVDLQNNIYVGGNLQGNVNFNKAGINFLSDSISTFFAKYDNSGNYQWAFKVGNVNNYLSGVNMTIDGQGSFVVGGQYMGAIDFNPDTSINLLVNPYWYFNVFFAKYTSSGKFLWANKINSSPLNVLTQSNALYGISSDKLGFLHITGFFEGKTCFNNINSTDTVIGHGNIGNLFLAEYDADGNYRWLFPMYSNSSVCANVGYNVCSDNSGNIVVGGIFAGYGNDFDPSSGIDTLTPNYCDFFTAKYNYTNEPQISLNQECLIFPNPTSDILNIESKSVITEIKIFDLLGQELPSFVESETSINGIEETKLNISTLSSGVYLLTLTLGNKKITKKILKRR